MTLTDTQTAMLARAVASLEDTNQPYGFELEGGDLSHLAELGLVEFDLTTRSPDNEKKVAVRATDAGKAYEGPVPGEVAGNPAEGDTPPQNAAEAGTEEVPQVESDTPLPGGEQPADGPGVEVDRGEAPEKVSADPDPAPDMEKAMNNIAKEVFKIQDSVPIPAKTRTPKATPYPFAMLKHGQSFFVAATKQMPDPAKTIGSKVATALKACAKVTGHVDTGKVHPTTGEVMQRPQYDRRFIVRKWEEDGVKGARVWCEFLS